MDRIARRRWHNMLVAAMADRTLAPEEKSYLEEMRRELGISQDEAGSIVADYKAKRGGIELSGTREQRLDLFRDIVRVFLADNRLSDREKKYMKTVALHLKLSQDELNNLIAECRNRSPDNREDASGQKTELKPAPAAQPAAIMPEAPRTLQTSKKHPAPDQQAETGSGNENPAPPPEVTGVIHEKTGIELLQVPAGKFIFGDMAVGGMEMDKAMKSFRIGKYPVTNAEWLKFEHDTGYQGRRDFGERFNRPRQPVVGVSLDDVLAFCEWAGLRLPTEVEWERAARGTDGRKYPWGNQYPSTKLCNFGSSLFDETQPRTTDVGAFPHDMTPAGCHDMVGNVEEWCDNGEPDNRGRYPVRGASWLSAIYALNVYYHYFRERDLRTYTIGFRVACDD